MIKKVNEDFEVDPYNDMFYGSCFYMTLFHLLKFYHKDVCYFLVYDTYYYGKSDKMICKKAKTDLQLLKELGIGVTLKQTNLNVGELLKETISGGNPAIIEIDTFYESFRKDTYQISHNPSALFVYGFDDVKNTFFVIEHTYANSLSYQTKEVEYEVIEEAYQGFIDNFLAESNLDCCYYECYPLEQYINVEFDYKKLLHENIKNNYTLMSEGKQHLQDIMKRIYGIISDVNLLENHVSELLDNTNFYLNAKKIEEYRLKRLYGDEEKIYTIIENCIKLWGTLRVTLTRYRLTGKYQCIKLDRIKENLEHIYEAEEQFISSIREY